MLFYPVGAIGTYIEPVAKKNRNRRLALEVTKTWNITFLTLSKKKSYYKIRYYKSMNFFYNPDSLPDADGVLERVDLSAITVASSVGCRFDNDFHLLEIL